MRGTRICAGPPRKGHGNPESGPRAGGRKEEGNAGRQESPRGSVDPCFAGQPDPLQVSLLARGSRKPVIDRPPTYSFPFPAPSFQGEASSAFGRQARLVGGNMGAMPPYSMKFRTAYSDELASDSHGIPRYAMKIPSGFSFRRIGLRPILHFPSYLVGTEPASRIPLNDRLSAGHRSLQGGRKGIMDRLPCLAGSGPGLHRVPESRPLFLFPFEDLPILIETGLCRF